MLLSLKEMIIYPEIETVKIFVDAVVTGSLV